MQNKLNLTWSVLMNSRNDANGIAADSLNYRLWKMVSDVVPALPGTL